MLSFRMLTRDKVSMGVGAVLTIAGGVVAATGAGLVPGAILMKIGVSALAGSAALSTGGTIAAAVGVTAVAIGAGNTITENTAHSNTREELNTTKTQLRNTQLANQTYTNQLNVLTSQQAAAQHQTKVLSQKLEESQNTIVALRVEVANSVIEKSAITEMDFESSDDETSTYKMKTL